ncbi:MAG TPA: hypothetical protein VE172_23105 [Stackebrandtia sp.]|nr:hypothetical protein [Stackebrandtia sp.]HZE41697.1 hypothetical protein [Stackebrandtia sp.]
MYRALLAARLDYGAAMALTPGRVTSGSPILRRLGFVSYGRERVVRVRLG